MLCRDVEQNELALKYLSRQLDSATEDSFEDHILECRNCQELLKVLQAVQDDLVRRADELRLHSPAPRGQLRWAWLSAVALIVVVTGVGTIPLMVHRHAPEVVEKKPQGTPASPVSTLASPPHSAQPTIENLPSVGAVKPGTILHNEVTVRESPSIHENPSPSPNSVALPAASQDAAVQRDSSVARLSSDNSDANKVGATLPELPVELKKLAQAKPPVYMPHAFNSAVIGLSNSAVKGQPVGGDSLSMARTQFHDAMLAYNEKKYGEAEALLDDAVKLAPGSSEMNLYLGICRMLNGKNEDAIPPLQTASRDEKSRYAQEAHFYLAKVFWGLGDLSHVEQELQAAAAMSGSLTAESKSALSAVQTLRGTSKPAQPSAPDKQK